MQRRPVPDAAPVHGHGCHHPGGGFWRGQRNVYRACWWRCRRFPLGAGGGTYGLVNGPYLAEIVEKARFLYDDILYTWWAHNEFLHYLAEYGVLTLGLAGLALFAIIRHRRKDSLDLAAVVLVVACASMFSWQMHSLPLRYLTIIALAGLCRPWPATALPVSSSLSSLLNTTAASLTTVLAAVFLTATLYNGYFDRQAVVLFKDLKRQGLATTHLDQLETIERQNPYIYNHLNKWFVEASLLPDHLDHFDRLKKHGRNFYRFETSFLSRYAYGYLLTFSTDDAERDYQEIMAVIDEGINLKPDYEKLWILKHYLNMLRFSHRTGIPIEDLKPDEENFDPEKIIETLKQQIEVVN